MALLCFYGSHARVAYGTLGTERCRCPSLPAFVTLLNGDQAQDAIRSFHQTSIRGREITVQLQPTDSLLCVTNLAHTFAGAAFEELVRAYGNIERCFLVYSELTGHSKGYGFVEYMKARTRPPGPAPSCWASRRATAPSWCSGPTSTS